MRSRLALGLLSLLLAAGVSSAAESPPRWRDLGNGFSVLETGARYRATTARPSGSLRSGQPADLVLAAIGFDDAGGPLLFNHPGTVASDGKRLLLADRNNNRVLVWNRLPSANTKPDLVLGQKGFRTIDEGAGRGQLDWPVSVSTGGGKVAVADTFNDRILVWTRFPTRSGQPADLVISHGGPGAAPNRALAWPWGVWTDGRKLVVSATGARAVLVWNTFPTRDDQPADLVLKGGGAVGTPRTITSDGNSLIVGDHNARVTASGQAAFVWKTWPTRDDQPYDYVLTDPLDPMGAWLSGDFTDDGKLILVGTRLYVWNRLPDGPGRSPDLILGDRRPGPGSGAGGLPYFGGDGSGAAVAGSRLYVSLANWNHVLGFKRLPASRAAKADFAIGSPDAQTNTLLTNYFITNPVPLTDGTRLFVSSDFDGQLSVYRRLPAESGAHPDLVYRLPAGGWQSTLDGGTLALVGRDLVAIWKTPPLGQAPDLVFRGSIGSVAFQELRGVALDRRFLYLADRRAGKVYVFDRLPGPSSEPKLTLSVPGVTRLSSDGTYLVATRTEGEGARVWVYGVADLTAPPQQVTGRFNLPEMALVAEGALFVAETPANRVHVWTRIADAVAGRPPDVLLAQQAGPPAIGRDGLFWPGALAFDGSYLWLGEFKFSGRLLRYSVR